MMETRERRELFAERFLVLRCRRTREFFERQLVTRPMPIFDQPDLTGPAFAEDPLPRVTVFGVVDGRHGRSLRQESAIRSLNFTKLSRWCDSMQFRSTADSKLLTVNS